jgi:hypothetical protein
MAATILSNWVGSLHGEVKVRLKTIIGSVVGSMAGLSMAACGGGSASSNATAPAAASSPSPASSPNPASAPTAASTPAVSPVVEAQNYSAYNYLDSALTSKAGTLTFQPNASTGTLTIAGANYATLTTDIANDAVMSVSGTPVTGVTLGEVAITGNAILEPGVIEACESVAGDGTPNPAFGNTSLKSTNVLVAGLPSNPEGAAGQSLTAYYEDCLRDGGPTAQTTHSSLLFDGSGNETLFDARTGTTTTIPVTNVLKLISTSGFHGEWLIPFLYANKSGQLRAAIIDRGLVSAGASRNFVGIWLEE